MEPQLPTPSPSPEQGPLYTSEQLPRSPEVAPQAPTPERNEVHEQKQDAQGGAPTKPVVQPVVPALPPKPQPIDDGFGADDNSNPSVAADDELIEKEWVEKAKKVIAETRHDPFLQEQEVSKLQADYLKKRYNKSVKVPTDG